MNKKFKYQPLCLKVKKINTITHFRFHDGQNNCRAIHTAWSHEVFFLLLHIHPFLILK